VVGPGVSASELADWQGDLVAGCWEAVVLL